jgi:hypothetical protein
LFFVTDFANGAYSFYFLHSFGHSNNSVSGGKLHHFGHEFGWNRNGRDFNYSISRGA